MPKFEVMSKTTVVSVTYIDAETEKEAMDYVRLNPYVSFYQKVASDEVVGCLQIPEGRTEEDWVQEITERGYY